MPVDLSIPNSIIQSYLAGTQLRRQREQDTLEQQNKERQFADFEKQLDAHLKDVEEQQKIRRQQQELHEKQFRLAARQTIMQGVKEGILKPSETTVQSPVPAVTPFGNFPAPAAVPTPGAMYEMEGVQVPQKDFIPLEQRRAAESDWFQKQLAMQSAAKVAEAKQLQPLALEKIQETGRQHIAQAQTIAQAASERAVYTATQRHLDTQARIAAQYAIAELRLKDKVDPEAVAALVKQATLGQADLSGTTPVTMAARKGIDAAKLVPFGKKSGEKLLLVHELTPIIQDMNELVDKYIKESKSGALSVFTQSKIPDTEVQRITDRIRAYAGQISKTMGGESSKLTEQDIERAKGLLVKPGMTKANAKIAIAKFQRDVVNKVSKGILGQIQNPKQKFDIIESNGFDPSIYGGTVKVGSQEVPFFQQNEKTGKWGYVDTKIGKVVALPTEED